VHKTAFTYASPLVFGVDIQKGNNEFFLNLFKTLGFRFYYRNLWYAHHC